MQRLWPKSAFCDKRIQQSQPVRLIYTLEETTTLSLYCIKLPEAGSKD